MLLYGKKYFCRKRRVILPYQSHMILHWQVVNVTVSLQINLNYCLLPTPLFNLVKILSKGSYRVCSKSCDLMVIIVSVSFKIGLAQLVACTSFAVQIWWLQPLLKGSFHLSSKSPYRASMMSLALMQIWSKLVVFCWPCYLNLVTITLTGKCYDSFSGSHNFNIIWLIAA